MPPCGQVERRFLRARRNELLRCESCPHPLPPARTREPPVLTHVNHTFPGQSEEMPSPPHHFTTSPSHHLTTSPSHHLTTSPSPHLTISPPHHLTTSPPYHLTTSPPDLATSPGDRNGPLTWFWPDIGAARGGARAAVSRRDIQHDKGNAIPGNRFFWKRPRAPPAGPVTP